MARRIGRTDLAIALLDEGIRTVCAAANPQRPSPAESLPPDPAFDAANRLMSARLMRVNRAGEIAAQALYLGQSLTAKEAATTQHLLAAADEERDHLAWCTARIAELGGRESVLDPIWFAGSACLGAAVGCTGDPSSLGFIDETERQVEAHLQDHLQRLPAGDIRSKAILEQMAADESRHGAAARLAGGEPIPVLARKLMALGGVLVRELAYRI